MKEIELTQGHFALVDDEDYDYLSQWKWYAKFNKATKSFYAARSSITANGSQKTILMHRVVMNISDSGMMADHKNHDTLNNCKLNLRIATSSQNCANRRRHISRASKYLGVCWHKQKNKWCAMIQKDYKNIHIGYFSDEIEAARARDKKAIELFGEFANLNTITSINLGKCPVVA